MTQPDAPRPCPGRRRHALAPALGMALAAGACLPAQAQLAPQMGVPVELGDLRKTFERAYGPADVPPVGARNWTFTPGIGLDVLATDNARALGVGGVRASSEVMTTITPSLLVQGASQRLTGSLSYAPQLRSFMNNARQNSVAQNLNANGRATIFQDLLFLNASAYATEYSRAGGLGGGTGGQLSRQDRVQTSSFSVGPLLRHTFADTGTAELSHSYAFQRITGQGLAQNTPFAPAVASGDRITNTTDASFTSGQDFGRFNFTVSVNRTAYDGPGVLKNAHRNSENLDLGYALTRDFTVLAQLGHQDVKYGGTNPLRINGAIWSLGGRWTPGPDTSMTARYGYRDGGSAYSFEGSTAPTARTRVTLSYSEAMANAAEELQYASTRTQLSASGITIDPKTGMPVILTNNFAGAQGGLARVRRVSLSGVLTGDVDVFTVTLNRDERQTLSGDAPGGPPSTSYLNATLGWQRELWPGVRGNAQASYGERTAGSAASVSQSIITFTAGLNWSLSETLTTRAAYTHTRSSSNQAGFGYEANLISLGVQKTF